LAFGDTGIRNLDSHFSAEIEKGIPCWSVEGPFFFYKKKLSLGYICRGKALFTFLYLKGNVSAFVNFSQCNFPICESQVILRAEKGSSLSATFTPALEVLPEPERIWDKGVLSIS
jgi:hypothetical protein